MTDRIPKSVLIGGAILTPVFLALLAYSQPGYFSSQTYLAGLIFLEFLFAALWMYRRVFFVVVLMAFLFAGTSLPVGGGWSVARWVVLGVGGLAGCVIMVKERGHRFCLFHALALFAGLAALASASVSRYPTFALLKASSLLLLFFYAATGARLAVSGRENQYFAGLLVGCEWFVGAMAACYFVGFQVMGNPNSLGAVAGVVGAPVLLWGALLEGKSRVRYRRFLLYAICMYLVFFSHARAAMAAALISCGLLCLALRKYKLFVQGVGILAILIALTAITRPEAFSNMVSSVTSSVLYKGRDAGMGLLASRESPWQQALDSIHENFWFGSGFGTTDNGQDISDRLDQFSTNAGVTAENGSSYLAIVAWVGMLGVVPFLLLLLVLVAAILRTLTWTFQNASPFHPAIPLAMVIIAGLLHAAFEDWLFAPGYYLCVFFWSLAFVLIDLAPPSAWRSFSSSLGRSWRAEPAAGGVIPSR